jgi:hypothetical protein
MSRTALERKGMATFLSLVGLLQIPALQLQNLALQGLLLLANCYAQAMQKKKKKKKKRKKKHVVR